MNGTKWLWAAIVVYLVVFGAMTSLRQYNFQTQAWDMGIFTQIMWNIVHGNGPVGTLEFVQNHFAVHMSPILFLLAPGFALFPSPYYLLIIQTLALALGAWPLYLLARKVLERRGALAISIAYLLYPSLHWVNWYDFHPVAFLVPFFLAAFYFAETRQWKWMSLFLILASGAQEDAVLAVAFFGIYLVIKDVGRPMDVRRLKIGILIFLLSTLYFVLATKFIMPSFGGGLLRLDRYAHLGGGFSGIFKNLFIHPELFLNAIFGWQKLAYLFWLFAPVAFLPLLAPREWVLLVPGLAQNLLTEYAPQFSGNYQYDSALIGGIFIAAVFGLKKVSRLFAGLARGAGTAPPKAGSAAAPPPVRLAGANWKSKKAACFLVAVPLLAFLLRSPVGPFYFPTEFFKTNERAAAFRAMLERAPENISVAAHTQLVPHLANREKIYMLGFEQNMPDIVLMDGADYFGFGAPEYFKQYAQRYADSGQYAVEILNDRYYILIKKK